MYCVQCTFFIRGLYGVHWATKGSHLLKHTHECLGIDSTFTYVNHYKMIYLAFRTVVNDKHYICNFLSFSILLPKGNTLNNPIGMNIELLYFQCLWCLLYCVSIHKQDSIHVD